MTCIGYKATSMLKGSTSVAHESDWVGLDMGGFLLA